MKALRESKGLLDMGIAAVGSSIFVQGRCEERSEDCELTSGRAPGPITSNDGKWTGRNGLVEE